MNPKFSREDKPNQGDNKMSYISTSTDKEMGPGPKAAWFRPQRNRQLACIVVLASIVGFATAAAIGWPILSSLFLLVVMVGWWQLRVSIRHIMDDLEEKLDERMLMMRDQTYRSAYIAANAAFVVLLILCSLLVGYYQVDVTMNHLYGIGFGFFWFMAILPTVTYAWTEPEV